VNQQQSAVFKRIPGWRASALCLAGAVLVSPAWAQQKQQLPDGPGKEPVERICNGCHGAEIVIGRGLTKDGWTQIVSDMISRGAQGSEDDFAQIVDYLAKNFPPQSDSSKDAQKKDQKQ
jgi:mono/diheme cytochrome c family protein